MKWGRRLVMLALVAGAVLGVVYVRSRPVPVEAYTAKLQTVIQTVMGTGSLEARVEATISPKIAGRLAKVLVDQGDRVSQGDVLATLDPEELQQQVRMAEAAIRTARASLGRYLAEIKQAQSTFNKAKADLNRVQTLLESRSVSEAEFDQTRESYELAESGLLKSEASALEAEERVAEAEASLKFHEARLADAQLMAPFDGLITERYRDPGSVAVPGTPVVHLISLDELWISAWVDETEIDKLVPEQPALIVFRSEPEKTYHGAVARLGKQSDRETREFVVDVRVVELPHNWAIGQRAEVFIETSRQEDTLTIPAKYLVRENGNLGCYVARQGTAIWTPVQTGIEGRGGVEIVSGMEAGDSVIIPQRERSLLRSGAKVRIP